MDARQEMSRPDMQVVQLIVLLLPWDLAAVGQQYTSSTARLLYLPPHPSMGMPHTSQHPSGRLPSASPATSAASSCSSNRSRSSPTLPHKNEPSTSTNNPSHCSLVVAARQRHQGA